MENASFSKSQIYFAYALSYYHDSIKVKIDYLLTRQEGQGRSFNIGG